MTYNRQLDGLRFIAIFGVFIAHWIQWVIPWDFVRELPYGTGVILFFVLSGYLITKILLEFRIGNAQTGKSNLGSVKAFYIRRTLRIFPIYYITIFFLFFLNFENTRELFPWLVTYTLNFHMVTAPSVGAFTHFWSLAVEEQFYLFWTFVIVFSPERYLKQVIISFILFSMILHYLLTYYSPFPQAAATLVITNMHKLGAGGLIAWWSIYHKEHFAGFSSRIIKIALLIIMAIFLVFYTWMPQYHYPNILKSLKEPILVVIYSGLIILAIKNSFHGIFKYFLENRVIVYLGKISYGMYVFHLFMSPFYWKFIVKYIHVPYSDIKGFIIFFIITVTLASLSWFLIEKPINDLKRCFKY
ncbi:MAG: acyltransferase [Bacteroidota bacterium]